jgi:hypothetical protein
MKNKLEKLLLQGKIADKQQNAYIYSLVHLTIIERGTYGNGDN